MTAAELKAWRERLNLSQASAADKLGCSRRSLQHWESGTYPVPPYIDMAASAVSMNLPPYGSKK